MTSQPGSDVADKALEPLFATSGSDDLSSHAYRQLIGSLGLVFPLALWLIAGLRPTRELARWDLLSSVSAYYYTGSVAVFVGILVSLGVFLFTYHGYKNEYSKQDRRASIIAGTAAILVAFFPTKAPLDSLAPSWWTPGTGKIHYISAVVLFCSFSFFSLFLFTKSKPDSGEPLTKGKRVRNRIYICCGILMAACIVWAGIASFLNAPIFLPEALALESFALSWLTKGRADRTAVSVARRTFYYGRNPRRLVADIRGAIRS
ncbi:MAG TPA: hypothetical protein VL197_08960 [Nitrospirota bacterium]|nr:hypothetical protein [Nitrospirota bacterium]